MEKEKCKHEAAYPIAITEDNDFIVLECECGEKLWLNLVYVSKF